MESILYYIIGVNLVGFFLMLLDKRKAIRGEFRIPERTIWSIAILGGAIGTYIGMRSFRHKTKHKSFMVGIPIIIILNILLFIYLS